MEISRHLPWNKKGIHVPHKKNTADSETASMPLPEKIKLSMVQHLGAPCVPLVSVGDKVAVGQPVGDSDAAVCAPIHSGVSGTVTAIERLQMPGKQAVDAVVIEADGEQRVYEGVAPPPLDTREEFLKAVRASGLVGLGGAGFPAHIKLNPPNLSEVDTLLINAAECEPYITTDYRECMENPEDILDGVRTVMRFLGMRHVIIAVERNKPAAITLLRRIAAEVSTPQRRVTVKALPSRYPQGAEKMLIYSCTGRRVPPGGLPSHVGCIVMNVTSVSFLNRYFKTGMPLISRRITVDGGAVARPQNLEAIVGTPINDILEYCGTDATRLQTLLMGGPMMGTPLMNGNMPLFKQNNAILALTAKESPRSGQQPCLRCGRCVSVCPMKLMPPALEAAFARDDADGLEKYGVMSCLECGCCAYVCPSGRFLNQSIRSGKEKLTKLKRKG